MLRLDGQGMVCSGPGRWHGMESTRDRPMQRAPQPVCKVDTLYTACTLEFCPSDRDLVACGLYQTEQLPEGSDQESPETRRLGACMLYGLEGAEEPESEPSLICKQIQQIDCPAVLDLKWTQHQQPVLFTADAEGHLSTCVLKRDQNQPRLEPARQSSCASRDVLCLSLDISDKRTCNMDPKIITSLSNGQVVVFNHDSRSFGLTEELRWHAHDFEPWTCSFDYWQPSTVLTGGDDCHLKIWDLRTGVGRPISTNKQFAGGVTAIRSHHLREHTFAVGSYDSQLRIFDKRNFSAPLHSFDVGGGIWRLKWHDDRSDKLLVAAMHNGFKVVDIDQADPPQLHTTYNEHASLAYGADWGRTITTRNQTKTLVGSCSFYDRSMQFWFADLTD